MELRVTTSDLATVVQLFIYIYIYILKEEGSQNKLKTKIPEGQEHAPRLEPTAPIRLAWKKCQHVPARNRTWDSSRLGWCSTN